MSSDTIENVQTVTVTQPDGTSDEFIVEEERENGALLIRRQTELERIHAEHGSQPLTQAEFDELIAPHIAPPDDEG